MHHCRGQQSSTVVGPRPPRLQDMGFLQRHVVTRTVTFFLSHRQYSVITLVHSLQSTYCNHLLVLPLRFPCGANRRLLSSTMSMLCDRIREKRMINVMIRDQCVTTLSLFSLQTCRNVNGYQPNRSLYVSFYSFPITHDSTTVSSPQFLTFPLCLAVTLLPHHPTSDQFSIMP